jgi:oligopeptide/dipeptide ABC transporter ATP-binding protein
VPDPAAPDALIEVQGLIKHFPATRGAGSRRVVHALDGVTFSVYEGETFAIVGESGCGKTTLGRCLVRLYEPTAGTIRFRGRDITRLPERELRPLRAEIQMVFQDPYSSLNPHKRVSAIVGDVLRAHGVADKQHIRREVDDLLTRVGLSPEHASRRPRSFSGGQRQRIGIARALALRPRLIVADEPVSALDVSIQAQIVNLLADLQQEYGLTLIFIAHDLGLVRHVSDRVAVLYLGKLVELANADELYAQPIHPYTEVLLSAVPIPDPVTSSQRKRIVLEGDLPSPLEPPSGCRFHTRCPHATDLCRAVEPPLVDHGGRLAACHHPRNVGSAGQRRAVDAASAVSTTSPAPSGLS